MPKPRIRFCLRSKASASGHWPVYLRAGVGEARPVRQATGYALHPTYFNAQIPHTWKGADKPWQVPVYRLRGAYWDCYYEEELQPAGRWVRV